MELAYQPDQQSDADFLLKKALVLAMTARPVLLKHKQVIFVEPASLRKQQDNRMCAITHKRIFYDSGDYQLEAD